MAYKERERYLDPEFYGYVYDRSGNATTTILIDGRLAGVWDMEKCGKVTTIKVFLFGKAGKKALMEIALHAKSLGAFIMGGPVKVALTGSMTPLANRPPGAVMSPLMDRSNISPIPSNKMLDSEV